jgi:cobalt/nickel transport system permease protein
VCHALERNFAFMHIPDGALSPSTCAACAAVMLPVWGAAARRARAALQSKQVSLLAALSAFSFTIMMFNVPALGGTTTHAIGATLLAVALGPWAAAIGVTVALAIQALLFADGGILALGANALALAFVGPFLGYAAYRALAGRAPLDSRRRVLAAGVGAYIGLNAAAVLVALLLGLQPHLFRDTSGKPLYFPFDLSVTLPALLLPHLLIAGVIEGVATAAGYRYLARAHRPLLEGASGGTASPGTLYWVLVALLLLAPVGLLAPGTAWGEWASEDLAKMAGYLPAGLGRLADRWDTPLADYRLGEPETFFGSAAGYWLSGLLGAGVIALLMALLGRVLAARRGG